ncbi:uncharacterized protein N7487_004143 [Penicillium crustosum]|uniref:uncharacterized protein n=1 Tax=Penicillium crustosum TaxID=36656 RepID=UPI0023A2F21E|nr:uncharacterized protein N7487_004143 [Penicillium crustosum]KAJ5409784.1 hypothetical protein N7487_004143 [Penicillium crustosum]
MVPLLNPPQSRLFADRTHDWILYPIEKRVLGEERTPSRPLDAMVQAVSTTGTQRSKPCSIIFVISVIPLISSPFSFYHLHLLSLSSIKTARVENLYDPGSPCSFSPFADFPAFPGLSLFSHHTATSFPAQRPLGNDLKALSLFILWSSLTSNAELQPSPIYQPPRPPAALTL